jgi:H+-transporting ATPase
LSLGLIALVWIYNLVWMVVQDIAKRAAYRELERRANGATAFLSRLKAPLHKRAAGA